MSTVAGLAELTRLGVRRDRVLVGAWTLVLVGVCYASAAATAPLYPTQADQVAAAEAINASPVVVALYGPILDVQQPRRAVDDQDDGALRRLRGDPRGRRRTTSHPHRGGVGARGAARRHRDRPRRAAHRSRRRRASPSRSWSACWRALADVAGGLPVAGSCCSEPPGWGSVSWRPAWRRCAASSRRARAPAARWRPRGLAVLFVLRAVGDTTSLSWLSWLSPFGWSTQLRAWSDPRWWVLLLYVVTTAVLVGAARLLRSRRDLGSGLLAARPGTGPRVARGWATRWHWRCACTRPPC